MARGGKTTTTTRPFFFTVFMQILWRSRASENGVLILMVMADERMFTNEYKLFHYPDFYGLCKFSIYRNRAFIMRRSCKFFFYL